MMVFLTNLKFKEFNKKYRKVGFGNYMVMILPRSKVKEMYRLCEYVKDLKH